MRVLFLLLLFCSGRAHAQEDSWYKMLEGHIGRYPVVMHLHKAGPAYYGYYYYQSSQQPMSLMGEDTSQSGTINLFVTSAGAAEGESFRFTLEGDSVKGNWQLSNKVKDLPFNARQRADALAMRYLYLRGQQPLKPGMEASPAASYEAAIVWPANEQGGGAAIQKEVLGFITQKSGEREPAGVLRQAQEAFFAHYQKDHADAKPEDLKEMPSAFTYDQTLRAMVAYKGKTILSLGLFSYAYTGGAHGNYGTGYSVFNLEGGTQLLLKDVLTPAGVKALPQLLAKAFRKKQGLSTSAPLTKGGLFENKIEPTDNFLLTGKAIGFNFVPYEIGPYAMGEITLYLPYQEIKPYLQPAFVNIVKKN